MCWVVVVAGIDASIWLEGSVRHLGSEVKDSPMVEDSVRLGFGGGVNWRF